MAKRKAQRDRVALQMRMLAGEPSILIRKGGR